MLPNLLPPDACLNYSRRRIENRRIRSKQCSNLMKKRRRDARIRREGGGGIVPKYQELVDMCENEVSIDE